MPVQIEYTNQKDFFRSLRELLMGSFSVLDVGCGVGFALREYPCPVKIGVDVHRPYLELAQKRTRMIPLLLDATSLDKVFLPNSVDVVTMIDVIEHFEKEEGLKVLKDAEKIAQKRVIIFTPRGFFKQVEEDHFGLGGEVYQKHRSGWEVEDFSSLGYKVKVFQDFHDQSNPSFVKAYGVDAPPIDALLAWKDLS